MKDLLVNVESKTTSSPPRRSRGRPCCSEAGGADALLHCARSAFAKTGYEATSVREIARLSGVDAALVAHHYGSKEALWIAVVNQIATDMEQMIADMASLRTFPKSTPRSRLESAVSLFVEQVFASPEVGVFFSTAATETGERLNLLIERLVRPLHDVFVPLVVDAIDAGQIPQQDPEIMFMMLANGISKTVAYSYVLTSFTSLPHRKNEFKDALLKSAFAMLG